MSLGVEVFDWDDGNWPKCGKHGLTKTDIEAVLLRPAGFAIDPSPDELRYRVVGATIDGRTAFVVITIRQRGGKSMVRPISARYMHLKEMKRYEQTRAEKVPGVQD